MQWTQHAGRDWSHYLQARIGRTSKPGDSQVLLTAPDAKPVEAFQAAASAKM
jgi:hypothetical protein